MDAMSEIELRNGTLAATVNTLGATLQRFRLETAGGCRDLVLSCLDDPYIGRTVGRFANRLDSGRFLVDGVEYQATINEPPNTLHGGVTGFSACEWEVVATTETSAALRLVSPDGDQGFPGRLEVAAAFDLGERALTVTYAATCDAPTIVNLTLHPYFNLGPGDTIDDMALQLPASEYTPVRADLIPTGEIAPVAGTGLDFAHPRRLAEARAQMLDEGRDNDGCLDHNFMVPGDGLREVARLIAPDGLTVVVVSDTPAVQVYDAAGFTGELTGPDGQRLCAHAGLAVEPQCPPDAPNQPGFPDTVLRPGQTYTRTISFIID